MNDMSFSIDTAFPQSVDDTAAGTGFEVGGYMDVECYDSDGKLKWTDRVHNIIPNAALDNILNVYYAAATQTTTFYMGMVDNAAFSAFAAADTMASHTGWTESTACSNSVRPTWTPGAASGQSIANGTQVTFTINATATIKGFFLTTVNTLGGTTGTLNATAALSSAQAVANGDSLKVTYTIAGSTT